MHRSQATVAFSMIHTSDTHAPFASVHSRSRLNPNRKCDIGELPTTCRDLPRICLRLS